MAPHDQKEKHKEASLGYLGVGLSVVLAYVVYLLVFKHSICVGEHMFEDILVSVGSVILLPAKLACSCISSLVLSLVSIPVKCLQLVGHKVVEAACGVFSTYLSYVGTSLKKILCVLKTTLAGLNTLR